MTRLMRVAARFAALSAPWPVTLSAPRFATLGAAWFVMLGAALCGLPGCHRGASKQPAPVARRPVLKSQTELAAERQVSIRSGRIKPSASPVVTDVERPPMVAVPQSPAAIPGPRAIQSDILLVDDQILTVREVLYAMRDEIERVRGEQTREGFLTWAQRAVRLRTRDEIGALLVFNEAHKELGAPQRKALDKYVDDQLARRVTVEFGGRSARLSAHLAAYELTTEQLKDRIRREAVVGQFSRERFWPRVSVRRDEMLDYYRANIGRFTSPERRELFMIQAPFAAFLPEGVEWDAAAAARAQAKLRALRHVRAAHQALDERSFEDVAREHSRGLRAAEGGRWGVLSKPLNAPYDRVSAKIFEFEAGQVSEPLETDTGWFLVKCGTIEAGGVRSFVDVQTEIRNALRQRRVDLLIAEYIVRLAERATISSKEAFIAAALHVLRDGYAAAQRRAQTSSDGGEADQSAVAGGRSSRDAPTPH